METLEALRKKIDSLDETLREAFLARMEAAAAIAGYKAQHGLPVLDAAREEAVVEKNLAALGAREKAMAPYYEDFVRHNMALSRALQQALLGRGAVAYQGVEGAFSHIALTRLFQHVRAQAYPTWAEVFDAVAGGDAAYGVLPFENSHAGDVSEVLDLCYAHRDICVCDVRPARQPESAGRSGRAFVGREKGCVPSAGAAAVGKVHPQPGAGNAGLPKYCRRGKKRSRGGR